MSDFQPGDRVIAIARELNDCPNSEGHSRVLAEHGPAGIVTGRIYTVATARLSSRCVGLLHLVELPLQHPGGCCAGRFRKIDPAEDEFTELVRKMQPIPAKQKDRTDA